MSLESDQNEFIQEQLRPTLGKIDGIRQELYELIEEGEENWLIPFDVDDLKDTLYDLETQITEAQEQAGWI